MAQIVVSGQHPTASAMEVSVIMWILGGAAALTEIMWGRNLFRPDVEAKMAQQSRYPDPRRKLAVAALLTLLALTACTTDNGPTATQAGQTLKNHVLQLLAERDASNVRVIDPGGRDLPCGDGKARRTFSATGMDVSKGSSQYVLRTAMLGALERVGHYKIVGQPRTTEAVRVADASSKTILTIDSPENGVYSISGETECLRAA
ncbi:hypothetical protein ACFFWE_22775 [Sphaerisporangium melleum]|uniref:hypothetical protein n=1 Tax=Sphaerisporangium melleum TaxID=321316 RepID=UPI00166EBF84|nr:hypothetical protein [Sphaerisporangium melleum]